MLIPSSNIDPVCWCYTSPTPQVTLSDEQTGFIFFVNGEGLANLSQIRFHKKKPGYLLEFKQHIQSKSLSTVSYNDP